MTAAIRAENVCKRYGRTVALDEVSFEVDTGEVFGIIGPSGSGKTTLLRCIAGLEIPDSGAIRVNRDGYAYCSRTPSESAGTAARGPVVGMVFQRAYLWPHMSVMQNVTLAQTVVLKRAEREAKTRAVDILGSLRILDKSDEMPDALSGGQMQRVSIARALAMAPSILLLDEVTAGLDEELIGGLQGIIKDLAHGGQTLVIVSHDVDFLSQICDRIGEIDDGRLSVAGNKGGESS